MPLSGKVQYDGWEYSPLDGSRTRYIDHVKNVADLRRLALGDGKHADHYACKIGEIAEAGGPDAHEANLALRDIVLNAPHGLNASSMTDMITEPEIASDPMIAEKLKEEGESRYEFKRAMIAADSGQPW